MSVDALDDYINVEFEEFTHEPLVRLGQHRKAMLVRQKQARAQLKALDRLGQPAIHFVVTERNIGG